MDLTTGPYGRQFDWLNPAWRWSRAMHLVENSLPIDPRRDDEWVHRALQYLTAANSQHTPVISADTRQIADAVNLAQGSMIRRFEIEARILAGLDSQTITKRAQVPLPVVEAFEMLFCDVRQQLRASGWIRNCVIHSEGNPGSACTRRGAILTMAYFGGERVTEDVLATLQRRGDYLVKPAELNRADSGLTDLDRMILSAIVMLTTPVTSETARFWIEAALQWQGLKRPSSDFGSTDSQLGPSSDPWASVWQQAYTRDVCPRSLAHRHTPGEATEAA